MSITASSEYKHAMIFLQARQKDVESYLANLDAKVKEQEKQILELQSERSKIIETTIYTSMFLSETSMKRLLNRKSAIESMTFELDNSLNAAKERQLDLLSEQANIAFILSDMSLVV